MSAITGYRVSPQQAFWWRNKEVLPQSVFIQLASPDVIDIGALRQRLRQIQASEEVLRTQLHFISGMQLPVQVISEEAVTDVYEEDWRHLATPQPRLQELTEANVDQLHLRLITVAPRQQILHMAAPAWMLDHHSLLLLAERVLGLATTPSEPLQYADYADWRNELIEGDDEHAGVAFWRNRPPTSDPKLVLGSAQQPNVDAPRTPAIRLTSEQIIPTSTASVLTLLAQSQDVELSHFLFACWHNLLARRTGETSLAAAWYDSGRTEETEDALGAYAQTWTMSSEQRLDKPLLNDQLTSLSASLQTARGWQDYLTAAPTSTPLFTWLPNSNNLQSHGYRLLASAAALYAGPLQLVCRPGANNTLHCRLLSHSGHASQTALDCLAEQWQRLLEGFVANPEQASGAIPLLGERQKKLIAPPEPLVEETDNVVEWLQHNAVATPTAIAVRDRHSALDYASFNARTNQLARELRSRNVSPGSIVGIYLPRSVDAIVAIFATLKAGAAYLPIDPEYPTERVRYMIEDSGISHVLCTQPLVPADAGDVTYMTIGALATFMAQQAKDDLSTALQPHDPAYLIYTSGSTGHPKAVIVSHSNLAHSTRARMVYYPQRVKAYLMLSSLSFDSSVGGIFWTLAQGGELVLPAPGDELVMNTLRRLIREHQISHGLSLPSLYESLLDGADTMELQSLTTWIVAGEACHEQTLVKHQQKIPQAQLVNEYGPTETTVWATAADLTADKAISIGRAIPGMQLHLLNEQGVPAALGEIGEIFLGGPQVTLGYLSRPEQTATAFVTRPRLSGEQVLYRSGDLARWNINGRLEFLGRKDHQVKVRGHRIELGEIERRLREHPQVSQAAVIARDLVVRGSVVGKRLAAYIISHQGQLLNTGALADYLANRLPEYMVPADFVALQSFPLTPNGKLDIQALPAPETVKSESFVAPRTPNEQVLAEIFAAVLARESVGIHDNFFRIGGDSILSLQVVARAAEAGLALTARHIFEHKTIAELAEVANAHACETPITATRSDYSWQDDIEMDSLLDEIDNADELA